MRRLSATLVSGLWLLAAPGVVAGLIPWWLTAGWRMRQPFPDVLAWLTPPLRMIGGALIVAGCGVLLHSFARFVTEGHGSPVPVAPPRRLVVGGGYRYVRNPMYVAVLAVLLGQVLLLGQPGLLGYAAAVWAVTAGFVYLYEQPVLARRFGPDYRAYRDAVPAWWPRLRPWTSDDRSGPES